MFRLLFVFIFSFCLSFASSLSHQYDKHLKEISLFLDPLLSENNQTIYSGVSKAYQTDLAFRNAIHYFFDKDKYNDVVLPFGVKKHVRSPRFQKIISFLADSAEKRGNKYAAALGIYFLYSTLEQVYPDRFIAKKGKVLKTVFYRYYPSFINTLLRNKECLGFLYAIHFYDKYYRDVRKAYESYIKGQDYCRQQAVSSRLKRRFFREGEKVSYIYSKLFSSGEASHKHIRNHKASGREGKK